MPDLADGETFEMRGSSATPYQLRNTGGVYSCTCPAWRNQSTPIERRTCKHLKKLRGEEAEIARCGEEAARARKPAATDEEEGAAGPPVLLAQKWTADIDITGWWMSEKLDGVRAYWDGKQFLSRLGNVFVAPDWFTRDLPETPLDGELWLGRKLFQRTVGVVRRTDKPDLWKDVKYVVFDAPALELPFEDRVAAIEEMLRGRAGYAQPHQHARVESIEHVVRELDRLCDLGAEGLMVRRPGSRYEAGRSTTLLKLKKFLDAEARVIGHQPGAGRHAGRLGALLAELDDGTRFSIGTGFSDAERQDPPPIGSTVTFRYQELSDAGVPRFPAYVGVRSDAPAAPFVAPAPAPKPAPAPAASGGRRRFELVEGSSSKFWEIEVAGAVQTVRYGKIGTAGQEKAKTFPDAATCARESEKLVAEKLAKGYAEVA
jgi:DNA ligase-1